MVQADKRKLDKLKFDQVINLARRLPQPAIHDLLRALILPIQADYLLAVGTEGQDARPDMNEREFFFSKIIWAMDYTHMKSLRLAAEDFPLALATAKILPWPWSESRYRSALADIGSAKGNPWVQDINHSVILWLPWRIGFVRGGNHSIASGILAGEGGQNVLRVIISGDLPGHVHGELVGQTHHRQKFPLAGRQGVDQGGREHGIDV